MDGAPALFYTYSHATGEFPREVRAANMDGTDGRLVSAELPASDELFSDFSVATAERRLVYRASGRTTDGDVRLYSAAY